MRLILWVSSMFICSAMHSAEEHKSVEETSQKNNSEEKIIRPAQRTLYIQLLAQLSLGDTNAQNWHSFYELLRRHYQFATPESDLKRESRENL